MCERKRERVGRWCERELGGCVCKGERVCVFEKDRMGKVRERENGEDVCV